MTARAVSPTIARLRQRVQLLEMEAREDSELRDRMAKILNGVADALHGGPLKNGLHSWHDLAGLAKVTYDRSKKVKP